jgi:hypothetical protein
MKIIKSSSANRMYYVGLALLMCLLAFDIVAGRAQAAAPPALIR